MCRFSRQIGIGDEMDVNRLKDVASEPHDFNIYLATNVTILSQDIPTRLTNALCNSKQLIGRYLALFSIRILC